MFRILYSKQSSVGCYCPLVVAYVFKRQHRNPLPQIRDHSGMGAYPNSMVTLVRGSICLISSDVGRFCDWAYIYQSICETLPFTRRLLGEQRSMMNGGPFYILIQGGLLMYRCHPAICQMVKIRRIGIKLLMVTAILTTGHTRG